MSTLVLSGESVSVKSESRRLLITRATDRDNPRVTMQVPLENVDRVVISGRPEITMAALQKIIRQGIPCFFTTSHGRWVGSVVPASDCNGARKIRQYQSSCNVELALLVSRELVEAKIVNSRRVLGKLAANHGVSLDDAIGSGMRELESLSIRALSAKGIEELRGYEGRAAAVYFPLLGRFFPKDVPFTSRRRHPPGDPANALLSWTYAILQGELDAAIRSHCLDPALGFYHAVTSGRPSLTLDLMEPLRAPICDRLVLSLFNRRVYGPEHFQRQADGSWRMRPGVQKAFFDAWEKLFSRSFHIPGEDNQIDMRWVLDRQAMEVVNIMEGGKRLGFFRLP